MNTNLVRTAMGRSVTEALRLLLSEKHLYQYAEINLQWVSNALTETQRELKAAMSSNPHMRGDPDREIVDAKQMILSGIWLPASVGTPVMSPTGQSIFIGFDLPTINTFCANCQERWPFNPVAEGSIVVQGEGLDETFYLGYRCQQCKSQPVRFLVRRDNLKLRLAGRYPMEVLPTPKVLPKGPNRYFSNAIIAHHAGQTLAGLFLLRVFIEQFWRTVPEVQKLISTHPKLTGDEQGSAYQATLPLDFKSRFPSLTDIYDRLSAAIHSADENAVLFDDSCDKIVEHFDARRLYRIG